MKCSICGRTLNGFGNNPAPVIIGTHKRCCDFCNWNYVIPTRMFITNVLDAAREGESFFEVPEMPTITGMVKAND